MLSHDLLNILACPACKGELCMDESGQKLYCRPCGICFPIRNGIPVLLMDEAQAIADQESGTINP